jgi:hypothetical protein
LDVNNINNGGSSMDVEAGVLIGIGGTVLVFVVGWLLRALYHENVKPWGYPICVDFDGVLHSYTSGYKGPRTIPDPPVPGAIEWLQSMTDTFTPYHIMIYSSRSSCIGGVAAMKAWLYKHGVTGEYQDNISFPKHKPPARLYIDDRAWRFEGKFPTIKEIKKFKPWLKRAHPRTSASLIEKYGIIKGTAVFEKEGKYYLKEDPVIVERSGLCVAMNDSLRVPRVQCTSCEITFYAINARTRECSGGKCPDCAGGVCPVMDFHSERCPDCGGALRPLSYPKRDPESNYD